jgi:CheY-like chemotaxis protein
MVAPPPLLDGRPWAFVDWVPPEMSGLELCRRLRADPQTEAAHVTMILEEDDAEAKRRALRAGADDYIVAPIDRNTVLDRVLSVQLPDHEAPARTLKLGDLTLDLAALQVRWKDKPVQLMPNEFRLLRYLMEQPGHVFPHAADRRAGQAWPADRRTHRGRLGQPPAPRPARSGRRLSAADRPLDGLRPRPAVRLVSSKRAAPEEAARPFSGSSGPVRPSELGPGAQTDGARRGGDDVGALPAASAGLEARELARSSNTLET